MAYCAKADLTERFGDQEITGLLDRDNSGVEDVNALDSAIADADALIDGYVAGRYTVPVSPVPAIIKAIACDVTRYKLWDDRAPKEVRQRYEDAVSMLRDISRGSVSLPGDPVPSESVGGIEYAETVRVFSYTTLADF